MPLPPRDEDVIRDRRSAPRLTSPFPVSLRDLGFVWKAEVANISSSGCLLRLQNALPVGKKLEVDLKPPGREPTRLKGEIVHVQPDKLAGFAFDLTASEDFERALDLFEWLLAQNPGLAVEVKKRPVQLRKHTMLWAIQDSEVSPRPEEAKFMTLFVGGRSLADAEKVIGPRARTLMYLTFSLLDRRLLSLVEPGKYRGSTR